MIFKVRLIILKPTNWRDQIPDSKSCPECHSELEKEFHTYLVLTRKGKEYKQLIYGTDGGSFCSSCDVVVLDSSMFREHVRYGTKHGSSFQFTVVGIVDLEAIPEDKKRVPLGTDDNPVPVVSFKDSKKLKSGSSPCTEVHQRARKFQIQQRKRPKK